MKSYFAKYLPLEGEINSGDFAKTPTGKVHRCLQVFESMPAKMDLEDGKLWQENELKKVKLFLCSRDIQIKDLKPRADIFYDDRGRTHEVTQSWIDSRTIFPKQWLKIIGEISPEAIWVKEGDEFEEEEWRSAMENADGTYVDHEKHTPFQEGYFAEIICPTCKKFH